jgi:hypothetical protein
MPIGAETQTEARIDLFGGGVRPVLVNLVGQCGNMGEATLGGSSSAVERQLPKLDVAGSIPVSRSISLSDSSISRDSTHSGRSEITK